jgi:alkylated DNA repair dioxygenase AlkB
MSGELTLQYDFTEIANILREIKDILKPKITYDIKEHDKIKGLYICENIITDEEENILLQNVNNQNWLNDLSRRVQHYGYKYDYKKRRIDKKDYVGELPDWTNYLTNRIYKIIKDNKLLNYDQPDQLIINEYKSSQGISAHVDCVPCFEDGIVSLTIGCEGIMTFKKNNSEYDVKLKRKSFALLTKESRYDWTHEINKTKNKQFTNVFPRLSLTFRKCIL